MSQALLGSWSLFSRISQTREKQTTAKTQCVGTMSEKGSPMTMSSQIQREREVISESFSNTLDKG